MTRSVALHLTSEFFPILAFYGSVQLTDFATSAAVLAGTTAVASMATWYYERCLPLISVSSSLFVIGAGLLSWIFSVPDILILADSLYYFCTAGALWWYGRRGIYLLERVFVGAFVMTPRGWNLLTWRWIIASVLAGVGNEWVRIGFSPEVWVHYKLVKIGLVILFVGSQFYLAKQHQPALPNNQPVPIR